MKYYAKATIEAVQLLGFDGNKPIFSEEPWWLAHEMGKETIIANRPYVIVNSLVGSYNVKKYDYILRDNNGTLSARKSEVFESLYGRKIND